MDGESGLLVITMATIFSAGIGIAVVIFVSTLFTLSFVARVIERFYFAGVGLSDGHGVPVGSGCVDDGREHHDLLGPGCAC